jgi:hypothetical protein
VGFLRRVLRLEEWLNDAAQSWRMLSDREYRAHVAAWRAAFDHHLRHTRKATVTPLLAVEQQLPFSGIVFTIVAHPGIPTSPQAGSNAPVYAYEATELRHLDRDVLASCDAIVSDNKLRFACIYTHEAGSLWEPMYIDRGVA